MQICILVVSLHVVTSLESSCVVTFQNSRYFSDQLIFSFLITLVYVTMHLRMHCHYCYQKLHALALQAL